MTQQILKCHLLQRLDELQLLLVQLIRVVRVVEIQLDSTTKSFQVTSPRQCSGKLLEFMDGCICAMIDRFLVRTKRLHRRRGGYELRILVI